jgi:hypothetical protein
MKKLLGLIIVLVIFAGTALPSFAQGCHRRVYYSSYYQPYYAHSYRRVYYTSSYRPYYARPYRRVYYAYPRRRVVFGFGYGRGYGYGGYGGYYHHRGFCRY